MLLVDLDPFFLFLSVISDTICFLRVINYGTIIADNIYHIPGSKIGMYIPCVISLLLKMKILIIRNDSVAAWKKML